MSGDMCATPSCGDIAHPGHNHCSGCIADRQAEREITHRKAREVTEAKENEIAATDEVVAA